MLKMIAYIVNQIGFVFHSYKKKKKNTTKKQRNLEQKLITVIKVNNLTEKNYKVNGVNFLRFRICTKSSVIYVSKKWEYNFLVSCCQVADILDSDAQ